MLLLSKYALDFKRYNEEFEPTTWEECTLRRWLNGEFLSGAFSAEERDRIILSDVPAHKNPEYDTGPGNGTEDGVFLLSCKEALEYLTEDAERVCTPTPYAKAQGSGTNDDGYCWWCLRSPGSGSALPAKVKDDGSLHSFGSFVDDDEAVRPALWIKL